METGDLYFKRTACPPNTRGTKKGGMSLDMPHVIGLFYSPRRGKRAAYICLYLGPSPPSGACQRILRNGHFPTQVRQWRQFDGLRTM